MDVQAKFAFQAPESGRLHIQAAPDVDVSMASLTGVEAISESWVNKAWKALLPYNYRHRNGVKLPLSDTHTCHRAHTTP